MSRNEMTHAIACSGMSKSFCMGTGRKGHIQKTIGGRTESICCSCLCKNRQKSIAKEDPEVWASGLIKVGNV